MSIWEKFDLKNKTAVITGGAGFLGMRHAEVLTEAGANVVLWDIEQSALDNAGSHIFSENNIKVFTQLVDITDDDCITRAVGQLTERYGSIDILINNAGINPKMENATNNNWSRLENLDVGIWNKELSVGLTGAMLCSRSIGTLMAANGSGVILNVASDLGIIAPDQRIYQNDKLPPDQQPVKPVTYSVVKHGLIGLTKYLATYWAQSGVRVNSISPGGVYNNQPDDFVARLTNLIPMGRMADKDEFKAVVLFLVSDASSYMTGANLVVDGGRTCW